MIKVEKSDLTEYSEEPIKKEQRQKHNYTSELELKSLLIRIKNSREYNFSQKNNKKINKYILWHTKINNKRYDNTIKKNIIKSKLKEKAVQLSTECNIDKISYERFGEIILLMIKNILKKPQFSGYTYRDDFFSDAVYKILKYLGNFNHMLISKITGQQVNSFSYISQIIHNSILFIINTKKKENENMRKQVSMEMLNHNLTLKNTDEVAESKYLTKFEIEEAEEINIKEIKISLLEEIKQIEFNEDGKHKYDIYYPMDYRISFKEYQDLRPYLKGKISIIRKK